MEKNSIGIIKISDEVITVIAGVASSEVEGIHPIFNFSNNNSSCTHKKSSFKGIKVYVVEDSTVIDINVAVDYGIKIPEVVKELQENIKNQVEVFTGVKVKDVNVYVQKVFNKTKEVIF